MTSGGISILKPALSVPQSCNAVTTRLTRVLIPLKPAQAKSSAKQKVVDFFQMCLTLRRYITVTIKHSFLVFYRLPKPSCNNILQPSPLHGSGFNTLSHSGLANVKTRKRMFYPLIKWTRSCEDVSYALCEQQRCRSACTSTQSDQHLCCLLPR